MRQRCKQIIAYSFCFVILNLFGGILTTWASSYLLSANSSSVAFGNVLVGKTTSYRLLLTNTGTGTVKISSLTTIGAEFKTTSLPLPYNLAPGQNFSVNIAFTPTNVGSITGGVWVASNATNSPSKTAISGAGVPATLAVIPGSVNFQSVPVGVANTQTVTLVNKGQSYIKITQVSASGTNFSIRGLYLPLSIAPGHSSAFTLRFAPTKIGTASGTLTIISNATDTSLAVPLAGNGVSSSSLLAPSTSSMNFGNVTVGFPSTIAISLANRGNTTVTVQGIKTSGSEFSAHGFAVPLTIAAGQSASFLVQFAPTVAGSAMGNVAVTSTAAATASNILLSGSGVLQATHSVALTWTPGGSGVVGYHVYRSANNGGPFERLGSSMIPGTTYTDLTVQAATQYFYVATAVDSVGIESFFSNEISVAIP